MVGSSNPALVARGPRLPNLGECLTGSSFEIGFGGKGANQAVMAARLGARVTIVTRVGADVFGDAYVRHYRDEGIETANVAIDEARLSGTTLILVDEPTGQNTMAFVPGANGGLSPDDVAAAQDAIVASEVVLCQLEVPIETTLEAFRVARDGRAGGHPLKVLNAAPVPGRPLPSELLELTDILVANEEEVESLAGQRVESVADATEVAALLAVRWDCTAVVTLGGRGSVHVVAGGTARHVAAPVLKAVDTTGAGDAFVGSLAFLLASGDPLPLAVERAGGVASLTVLSHGSQASYPTRAQVRERLGW
jgi:ribokinase